MVVSDLSGYTAPAFKTANKVESIVLLDANSLCDSPPHLPSTYASSFSTSSKLSIASSLIEPIFFLSILSYSISNLSYNSSAFFASTSPQFSVFDIFFALYFINCLIKSFDFLKSFSHNNDATPTICGTAILVP